MKPYIVLFCILLCTIGCGAQTVCNSATTELAAGCPSNGLASITLTPSSATVGVGGTQTFIATGWDGANGTGNNVGVVTGLCNWSPLVSAVATFNNALVPTITGAGAGTVNATCTIPAAGITSAVAVVTVTSGPVITNPNQNGCANPCPLPSGQINVVYNGSGDQFTATDPNTPLTWDCNGSCSGLLPTGMTLSSGGLLSGTPTASGTFNFTLRVVDNISASATLAVTLVINGSTCGPPTYPCSSAPSFATCSASPGSAGCAPSWGTGGVMAPPFTETSYSGKATSNGTTTITWVSSNSGTPSQFPSSCPNNTPMTFNGAGILLASCASTTVTATATVASATSKNYAICISGTPAGCQNTVAYGIINPVGVDAITQIYDITTNTNGQSIGNFTCSGGANNAAISALGNYVGGVMSGSGFNILHIQITGSPSHINVINTGFPALTLSCPAAFGNASADDTAAFYITTNGGGQSTAVNKATWNSAATSFTANSQLCVGGTIGGCTTPIDFALCPGIYPLTINGNVINNNSEFVLSSDDDLIVQSFSSVGTQGFNHIVSGIQVSTGKCSTVNLITGQVYAACAVGTAGDTCATELPGSTLGTGANSCWGIPVYTGFADTADGKNFSTHNGANFGFTANQTLSLHCQSSGNCTASAIPLTNPAGFNCIAGVFQCQFAMSSVSGNTLVLSSTTTAGKLGCSTLPCTVQYAVLNGIHGVQLSGDSNNIWTSFGSQGGWGVSGFSQTTAVACAQGNAGSTTGSQATYLTYNRSGTGFQTTTQWATATTAGTCSAGSCTGTNGTQWDQHPSIGYSKTVSAFYTGPNIRNNSNLTAWTIFSGANNTLMIDSHGTHPLFVAGNGATPNDAAPYISMSDSPQTPVGNGPCGNPTYCPTYLNLVAFAYYPGTVYPNGTNPTIFFPNYNCGNASGARCNDGAAAGFEEVNSISYTDPQGRFMCWGSSMLHSLGKDASGSPFIGGFCGMLQ